MNPCFFIVTFKRDLQMADWCVRSIAKFVSGQYDICVAAPRVDEAEVRRIFDGRTKMAFFDEPPGQGFNAQQCVKCEADLYAPGHSHYIHIDSDCLITKPFNVMRLFKRPGRPIWYYGDYAKLITPQNWPLRNWQAAVQEAIGTKPLREYMRKFPIVIPAKVYPDARKIIEHRHKKSFSAYVFSCKSEFPQTFAEFNTLGFVADIGGHDIEFVNWERATDWDLCAGFHGPAGVHFKMPGGLMAGRSMYEVAAELGVLS